MLSLDRSSGLLNLARHGSINECIRADLGFQGWRRGVFVRRNTHPKFRIRS